MNELCTDTYKNQNIYTMYSYSNNVSINVISLRLHTAMNLLSIIIRRVCYLIDVLLRKIRSFKEIFFAFFLQGKIQKRRASA